MDQIQHKFLDIRGLKLHVAEIGTGPVTVVFLHGFPEIWYTWRFQMVAVANAGFRALAPDFRGYGLSQQPPEPESGSYMDLVEDLLAMLDVLGIKKAFLVGKDFGALPVAQFAVLHPDRLLGMVTLGVPFILIGLHSVRTECFPEGFYISRWKEPGRAEADFSRFSVKTVIRNIYILFSKSEVPISSPDQEIMDLVTPTTPLPPWFTDKDLTAYANLYEKSGFRFPLHVTYRMLKEVQSSKDPKVQLPALLIMGEKDYFLNFPGIEDYIKSGKVKQYVPELETIFVPEGSHFVHEQFPDQVNQYILTFLNRHAA